jgi:hypothetical protein
VQTALEPGARSFSPAISLAGFADRNAAPAPRADTDGGWRTTASTATTEPQYRTLEPTSPESRYRLIVDIQQQLKRVGCYWGRIDGSWGSSSKYAIQSFMERVNAALPTDNPDYVLLTLLQSQPGKVCGTCAEGQTLTPGGRCVANATVAYGQPPPPGARETLPWQATTTTTTANPAPTAAKPLFTPLPTSVVSTEPLPGRMTVGGPKELPPVNTVYAPAATPAGNGQPPGVATVAIEPQDSPPAAAARPSKPRTSSSKKVRREGPGTPRYNLMLSLGGVY